MPDRPAHAQESHTVTDTLPFALAVLVFAAAGLAAVLSHRLTERLKIPAAALLLVTSAIAVKAIPSLHAPSERTVERLVTLALLVILFDGGMHIGWRRFSASASPIVLVGVLGTFLTVAGAAVLARFAF